MKAEELVQEINRLRAERNMTNEETQLVLLLRLVIAIEALADKVKFTIANRQNKADVNNTLK